MVDIISKILNFYGFPENPINEWGKDDVVKFQEVLYGLCIETGDVPQALTAFSTRAGYPEEGARVHSVLGAVLIRKIHLIQESQMSIADEGPSTKEWQRKYQEARDQFRNERE